MKVLVFDIWGDFGHFKKFYTTSSPLTFSVPPPTAVYGMLGAILGFRKEEYLKYINGRTTKLAIQILNPVKKIRMTLNYIDTKNSNSFHLIKTRTQIKTEFLKNPAYRLFVNLNEEDLFNKLIEKVKNKESFYTLSLGLSNLIANFKFVDISEAVPIDKTEYVNSTILSKNVKNIEIQEGKRYFKEKLPLDMNTDREVLRYEDVIMELNGNKLEGSFENCYKVRNSIISFV
ncbi:CRISPR-associated protein Cas5h [Persephonella hydrogeniphila]|uniref:CRISPR-associated protein Cas5h n=1 Tax=Persephonella hydrogeniphila TaxID=198703 RepID=A0A285NS60_9AQUI|nr:type I-B CRISPR-associated protein Cas5b [Persephonella hydrogeniphila]SNZ10666.1 CRISPR-associated protein Cas5h [Persephonella hydrogeniphila]